MTALALFAYGVVALLALSGLTNALTRRADRLDVLSRLGACLLLFAGSFWLAWLDNAGRLTAVWAWSAAAAATTGLGSSHLLLTLRKSRP